MSRHETNPYLDRGAVSAVVMHAPVLPRPFPEPLGMTAEDWRRIPVTWISPSVLVPSQQGVSLYRLADLFNGGDPEGGDYGRAVAHKGTLYLFDSHHRWLIALLRGDATYPIRVGVAAGECE